MRTIHPNQPEKLMKIFSFMWFDFYSKKFKIKEKPNIQRK